MQSLAPSNLIKQAKAEYEIGMVRKIEPLFKKWANYDLFSIYFCLFNMLQLKFKFKLRKA